MLNPGTAEIWGRVSLASPTRHQQHLFPSSLPHAVTLKMSPDPAKCPREGSRANMPPL